MKKIVPFIVYLATVIGGGNAVAETASPQLSGFVSPSAYNTMYPYMNNQMRVAMNPGTTPSQASNQINAVAKTGDLSPNGRRVVARGSAAGSAARAATSASTVARSGVTTGAANFQGLTNTVPRRVVARGATRGGDTGSTVNRANARSGPIAQDTTTEPVTSSRCMADYVQCMNGYCQRENTAYNRCYCSSRLSQIDSTYQPAIDGLIRQILALKDGASPYTAEEMDEYWQDKIGKYTGDNSWHDLDAALDINWADTDSRVRGQQAFLTGHEYCVQHLRGCYYMASNMRDAYRSDIARDCSAYETSLQNIKTVADSIIEHYSE